MSRTRSCTSVLLFVGILLAIGSSPSELQAVRLKFARNDPALAASLKWVADRQKEDGHWASDGTAYNDVEVTSLALLALMGSGETHRTVKNAVNAKNIERGLKFLMMKQTADGAFDKGVRSHALATLFISEAYSLTGDFFTKEPAQKALDHLVKLQLADGGWNEKPTASGDALITCWAVQALMSGYYGTLKIERTTFTRVVAFLNGIKTDEPGSTYSRSKGGRTDAAATAAMLLCRLYLGWKANSTAVQNGLEYLSANPPGTNPRDFHSLLLVTQLYDRVPGEARMKWEGGLQDMVLNSMTSEGENRSSWSVDGMRLVPTALALLTLEVPYRFLQLHRRVP